MSRAPTDWNVAITSSLQNSMQKSDKTLISETPSESHAGDILLLPNSDTGILDVSISACAYRQMAGKNDHVVLPSYGRRRSLFAVALMEVGHRAPGNPHCIHGQEQ